MHHCTPPGNAVDANQLKTMEEFAYLGRLLSRSTHIDEKVACRLHKASQAFGRLQASVRNGHDLRLVTKQKTYEAAILTTPLHGAKTLTVYSTHARNPNRFRFRCLHRIENQGRQDRILGMEVLERTEILDIHARLKQRQLRRSGHLISLNKLKNTGAACLCHFSLRPLFRNPPVIRMNYGWAIADGVNDPYEGPKSNSGICKKS
ncbi:hypothetical protein SprV_0501940200 [Sparganum proliferum]